MGYGFQWKKWRMTEAVGQRIEESVKSVYARVRDPLVEELGSLRARADELGRRIESQLHRKNASAEGEAPEEGAPKPPEGAR